MANTGTQGRANSKRCQINPPCSRAPEFCHEMSILVEIFQHGAAVPALALSREHHCLHLLKWFLVVQGSLESRRHHAGHQELLTSMQ